MRLDGSYLFSDEDEKAGKASLVAGAGNIPSWPSRNRGQLFQWLAIRNEPRDDSEGADYARLRFFFV